MRNEKEKKDDNRFMLHIIAFLVSFITTTALLILWRPFT